MQLLLVVEQTRREDGRMVVTAPLVRMGRALFDVELRFPNGTKRRAQAFGLSSGLAVRGSDLVPGTEVWCDR